MIHSKRIQLVFAEGKKKINNNCNGLTDEADLAMAMISHIPDFSCPSKCSKSSLFPDLKSWRWLTLERLKTSGKPVLELDFEFMYQTRT